MMTSQIEAQIPPLVQIKDAVTAGYAASLYIAERDKGPHGKRLAVLEIDRTTESSACSISKISGSKSKRWKRCTLCR